MRLHAKKIISKSLKREETVKSACEGLEKGKSEDLAIKELLLYVTTQRKLVGQKVGEISSKSGGSQREGKVGRKTPLAWRRQTRTIARTGRGTKHWMRKVFTKIETLGGRLPPARKKGGVKG